MTPLPPQNNAAAPRTLPGAIGWLLLGWLCASLFGQAVLEDPQSSAVFVSPMLGGELLEAFGGRTTPDGLTTVPLAGVAAVTAIATLVTWLGGAAVIVTVCRRRWEETLIGWGSRGWKWWCLPGLWYVFWLTTTLIGADGLSAILEASVELWWSVALAGWLTTFVGLAWPPDETTGHRRLPGWGPVALAIGLYTLVFTWMNWQLYAGLLVPHGDSAMYEEHLWNITHGKGFRSYLDQGLFLGEHIQVIHLGLLPLYLLWPSHLLLELCESFALALTALPMYWITRRHTGSERTAVWIAVATLLCFPLQYLDIAIDLKTFRPISFGVPLLLCAIDQMERRRWASMTLLLIATLAAKEDFAIVIAPLGVWLFATTWWEQKSRFKTVTSEVAGSEAKRMALQSQHRAFPSDRPSHSQSLIVGAAMAVLATAYLFLAVKVVIPWFRDGGTVHYARYFSRFGETPTEIVTNMLTQPGLLFGELVTAGTLLYAVRILIPLGGVPLLSPSRLLVGAPLFVLLCLNELAQETPAPVHHFHAPLLPILFWAAAAGLANVPSLVERFRRRSTTRKASVLAMARFAGLCALATGLVVSIHPLSRKFWDAGSVMHWQRMYVPGERAARFAEILPLIPESSRVASTDFVHPRFTHHERSYDYSGYLRKVAGYEQHVPSDANFIVIDTRHPYSTMHDPDDVPEFHQPGQWELLTNEPDPWFIVLKRRNQ